MSSQTPTTKIWTLRQLQEELDIIGLEQNEPLAKGLIDEGFNTLDSLLAADESDLTACGFTRRGDIKKFKVWQQQKNQGLTAPSMAIEQPPLPLESKVYTSSNPETNRVMISFNVKTMGPLAEAVFSLLTKEGFNVWICTKNIPPGVEWRDSIQSALLGSNYCVVFLNDEWINSGECQHEFKIALTLYNKQKTPKIIPIVFPSGKRYLDSSAIGIGANFNCVFEDDVNISSTSRNVTNLVKGLSLLPVVKQEQSSVSAISSLPVVAAPVSSSSKLNWCNAFEKKENWASLCFRLIESTDSVQAKDGCAEIFRLAQTSSSNRMLLFSSGAPEAVLHVLVTFLENPEAVKFAALSLWWLSVEDPTRISLGLIGVSKPLVEALFKYSKNGEIVKPICGAIGNICHIPYNQELLGEAGACAGVLTVLPIFKKSSDICQECHWAITHLAENKTNRSLLLKSNAVKIINDSAPNSWKSAALSSLS